MSNLETSFMQPDDLYQLQFIKDTEVSPDGNHIVYAVASYTDTDTKEDAKEERVTLWIYSLLNHTGYQLTSGAGMDNFPRWSPDSKTVAFLSTREKVPQLFTINVSGGEAQQLTKLEYGLGSPPVWSPDGTKILFTAKKQEKINPTKPYRVTRHVYRFDAFGNVQQNK